MRANMLQKIRIFVVTVYATLRITLIVLYKVNFRGGYPRWYGDKWLRWWARELVDAVRIRYMVIDPHHTRIEPGKRYIVMGNHRSHYDIPLSVLAIPGSVRMLTKKELFKVPLWGKGMTAGEFISIDRHDFEQAKRDLAAARAKMEDGIVLWIAPEGTRSRTGGLIAAHAGVSMVALRSGAPIIPCALVGMDYLPMAGTRRPLRGYPKVTTIFGEPFHLLLEKPEGGRWSFDDLTDAMMIEMAHVTCCHRRWKRECLETLSRVNSTVFSPRIAHAKRNNQPSYERV